MAASEIIFCFIVRHVAVGIFHVAACLFLVFSHYRENVLNLYYLVHFLAADRGGSKNKLKLCLRTDS